MGIEVEREVMELWSKWKGQYLLIFPCRTTNNTKNYTILVKTVLIQARFEGNNKHDIVCTSQEQKLNDWRNLYRSMS